MKSILLTILFINYVFILGCSEKKRYDVKKIDYKQTVENMFGKYGYEYNHFLKKKHADIIEVEVLKSKMSFFNYEENIKKNLLNEGWRVVPKRIEGEDIYCLGSATRMTVSSFSERESSDPNKWYIYIYFNDYGIKYCE